MFLITAVFMYPHNLRKIMTFEVVTYPIVLQKHMLTVYKKSYFPPSSSGT